MLASATSATGSSWSTERASLVAEALRGAHTGRSTMQTLRMRVYGESMLPALWPGDIVEIAPCSPRDPRQGEIVLALRDGRLFLHRLIAPIDAGGFLLCGDSMPAPDPCFPIECLLGRLVRRSSAEQSYSWSDQALRPGLPASISRALGIILCYVTPARSLALRWHERKKRLGGDFRESEPIAEPEGV
jgi:hypothetical protein